MVIVELRQGRRVGLDCGQLGRIHGGERIVARREHDVRAVVEHRLDVDRGIGLPGDQRVERRDVRNGCEHLADRLGGKVLPVG